MSSACAKLAGNTSWLCSTGCSSSGTFALQETRRHFEALLQLGAGVSGSPAAEQLAQLVRQYLQVRFAHI